MFTTKSSERHYLKVVNIVAEQFTTKFLQCVPGKNGVKGLLFGCQLTCLQEVQNLLSITTFKTLS